MHLLMKTSLVFLALALSGVVKAQTGFAEFPYNPDSDGDDFIGITDLLSLLSLYESEFSEEGLYLTSDSTEALYYTGNKTYAQCHKSCHDLPGKWWIPSYEEMLGFDQSMLSNLGGSLAWLNPQVIGRHNLPIDQERAIFVTDRIGELTAQDNQVGSTICFCYTRERPKVEYSVCWGNTSDIYGEIFTTCIAQKTSDGWYPLGSLVMSSYNQPVQSFWRWKE